MKCKHMNFDATVSVARLEPEPMKFMAHVTIKCVECGKPFCFLGLPLGLNLQGAMASVDRTEARLAIAPQGETVTELDEFAAALHRSQGSSH